MFHTTYPSLYYKSKSKSKSKSKRKSKSKSTISTSRPVEIWCLFIWLLNQHQQRRYGTTASPFRSKYFICRDQHYWYCAERISWFMNKFSSPYYFFGNLSFKFNLMWLPTKPNIVTSMKLTHRVDHKVFAHIFFTILLLAKKLYCMEITHWHYS